MSGVFQSSECNVGSTQPAAGDPSTSFLSLAGELRNKIYELLLVHQEPINPLVEDDQQQELTPGLLRANKAVHREASAVFYGQNCFDFTEATAQEVASLLDQIGSNNASYIRHLFIDFPKFLHLDPSDVSLEDDSVDILENIQSACVNLTTLTTSLFSTDAMEFELDNLDNHNVVKEALQLVDARFRVDLSLQDIILEVFEDGPSDHNRRMMKGHGWTISPTEYAEEGPCDRDYSDLDGYVYDYESSDDDDDDDDDYDIDNDSDFWRRAAD